MFQRVFGTNSGAENKTLNYIDFIKKLDVRLNEYFNQQKNYIQCKIGCSSCCEKGDYPLSQVELEYMMQGYIELENSTKKTVQNNIKNMIRGETCPFLINHQCSIYPYRPIICRTHGLAYLLKNNTVKVPYCVKEGKNFAHVYQNGEIDINPIKECLETSEILKDINYGEIRNLYDWLNNK